MYCCRVTNAPPADANQTGHAHKSKSRNVSIRRAKGQDEKIESPRLMMVPRATLYAVGSTSSCFPHARSRRRHIRGQRASMKNRQFLPLVCAPDRSTMERVEDSNQGLTHQTSNKQDAAKNSSHDLNTFTEGSGLWVGSTLTRGFPPSL